ncbi:MAG: GT4 family glycosyltransferase PelF [Acidimicrobiales bacterium]
MNITLITEGTYPHHMGGVSVWCDQLLSHIPDHRFDILAISGGADEKNVWEMPSNVGTVSTVPLWAPVPSRRASRDLRARFMPVQERLLHSLAVENNGAGFAQCLQELAGFARAGELTAAMSSKDAVSMLMEIAPNCQERLGAAGQERLSVADAVDILVRLEHSLRPLAIAPPEADLCHTTANGLGTLPALAAKWANGTPFLLTEHGVYLRELYLAHPPGSMSQLARSTVLRFFKLLIETAYEYADIVAPVCRYNRLWEVANGTPPSRIRPVHNGVDPKAFPVATSEPALPTLVFVGRIDPLKDIETLLWAFAGVRAKLPKARLRLFGPVPEGGEAYFQRCTQLASELGLSDGGANFEGKISPPAQAYHTGHVVVLTSISEGLPYVVLEAMASGRPVVATDVGGVAEAVGDAGLLVPPKDPSAVASACVTLLSDKRKRKALARASRARVLEFFDVKHCFATYRGLYEELVKDDFETIDLRDLGEAEVAEPVEVAEPAEVVASYRPAAFEGSLLRPRRPRSLKPGVLG